MALKNLYLLLIIFATPLVATVNARAEPFQSQQTGILWKIEKPGYRASYLLGTVHSDDSRIINFPDVIRQTLQQADSFTAELKMDSASNQEAGQLMLLPPGQKLEQLIGKNRFNKCVSLLLQYGVPETVIQRMKVWAVVIMLSMPKNRTGLVMDHRLYMEAELNGKKTYGLETSREQVAVFEAYSLKEQIVMLDDAIKGFDRLPAMFDELLHFYLKRDLTGLERISEKYMMEGDQALARSFKKRVLTDRNFRMVRRMKPRLMEGNSFIAVGALHLPGREGILQLLVREGFRLTPLY